VSFAEIEVQEGTCQSTATGYWVDWNDKTHEASPDWYSLAELIEGKGYQWAEEDTVYTGKKTPVGTLANGTFTWAIPNMYRKKGTITPA